MKTKLTFLAAASLLLLGVNGGLAQTANTTQLLSASQLKGSQVKNLQNEQLGTIEEVLVDPGSGNLRFAVLSVGGFLGLGDTEVAVPWKALRVMGDPGSTVYVLDTTKDRLSKAPRVEGKRYDRLYSRQDAEPTFTYWGVTWYAIEPAASPSPGSSPALGSASSPAATGAASPASKPAASPATTPAARDTAAPAGTPAASSKGTVSPTPGR